MITRLLLNALLLFLPILLHGSSILQKDTSRVSRPLASAIKFPRFAFGVAYVPYYSGTVYVIDSDPSNVYSVTSLYLKQVYRSFSELQASWRFNISNLLALNLSFAYNGTRDERNMNYIITKEVDFDASDSLKTLLEKQANRTMDNRQFSARLGFLLYLKRPRIHSVAPFVTLGVGKSFSSVKTYLRPLNFSYLDDDKYEEQTNLSDFERDFNSPWRFDLGAGSEYFFNRSLSLKAFIRCYFLKRKGTLKIIRKYKWSLTSNFYRNVIRQMDFETHVGIGFNFYF